MNSIINMFYLNHQFKFVKYYMSKYMKPFFENNTTILCRTRKVSNSITKVSELQEKFASRTEYSVFQLSYEEKTIFK